MTATQLSLDAADGLPEAFLARWRELGGGPAVSGESCVHAHGRWWLVVRVEGIGRFAFCHRDDLRACADELWKRCSS